MQTPTQSGQPRHRIRVSDHHDQNPGDAYKNGGPVGGTELWESVTTAAIMKDFIATERYGFERILMQLLIPGLVALGPFVWLLFRIHEPMQGRLIVFASANKELALFLVFVLAIIAGAIIEELALRLEPQLIDRWNSRRDPNLKPIWYAYLRLRNEEKTSMSVMPDYNSSVVARFKFTMSLSIALMVCFIGLVILILLEVLLLKAAAAWVLPSLLFTGAVYLFSESKGTALLLHDNRVLILQAFGQLPVDYDEPLGKDCPDNDERYVLKIKGATCCRACRAFRILDASKDYWLVEASAREPDTAPWLAKRSRGCKHIRIGALQYLHPTTVEKYTKPAPHTK